MVEQKCEVGSFQLQSQSEDHGPSDWQTAEAVAASDESLQQVQMVHYWH